MFYFQGNGPNLSLPAQQIEEMRAALSELHIDSSKDSNFKRDFQKYAATDYEKEVQKSLIKMKKVMQENQEIFDINNEILYYEFMNAIQSEQYIEYQSFRESLPSFAIRNEILQIIEENQVILIKGETGNLKKSQKFRLL